jgi:hypothetical protein
MYLVFVVGIWIIFGFIFIDRKNYKPYIPTIVYYCMMNLLYEFLYYNHSLFAFRAITTKFLNHTIIELAFLFIIMPVVILIFLQRLPEGPIKRAKYILVWVIFFWVIEYLFNLKGMYVYENGWNIWHSGWFNLMMFNLFALHKRRPVFTLGLTLVLAAIFTLLFPIPFSSLK